VLGNVGTYTGPVGASSGAVPTMILVWAQWVNAHGGIAGHRVQIFTADDGGDPARNRAEVQDMVESKHVIAFIANEVPLTIEASRPYLEQKHIPVIGGDMANTAWTSSPVIFPVGTTFLPQLDATLKAAHEANATKLAVVYCVEAPTCDLINKHINEAAAKYGEQIVYTSRISLTQPDFTAQCLGAQQSGAQALWLGTDASSAPRLATSCARQNYHPLYLSSMVANTSSEAQAPALDGMVAASPDFPWMVAGGSPEIDAYHEAIRQYAPTFEESGAAADAWVAGELLKKVAANIGPTPTTDAIFHGLWAIRNDTVGGLAPPLTYAAQQASPEITCYFITKVSGGKWTAPNGARYQCL
jgi:branched-chain amino acid transport system substrate-binding protein